MTKNRIRWISTCNFEGELGVVQVSRDEVREYIAGDASAQRLGDVCEELAHADRGVLIPDPRCSLAWLWCPYSKDLWPESRPF
jgi:hypothetical protein